MNKRVTAFACAMFAGSLFGQSVIPNNPGKKPTVAIRNATIYPVTSAPIENGTIVFANGTITAVGRDVAIPQGAMVIDGTGLRVYPGMIDSGSRVGLVEIDSVPGSVDTAELGDINPNARAEIAVNPHSNVIPVTRVNGITTAIVEPTGGIISGSSALMQLAGWTPQEMVVKAPVAMHIHFPRLRGGRFAEVPQDEEAEKEAKKNYTQQVDKLRDTLRDAQAYAKAVAARAKDTTVHRPERKKRNIPVIPGPILELPPREDDPYDLIFANAKALYDAGIPFSIQTQDAHNARNLPYQAAACAAFGLPKDAALKAVTIFPAQIFGVADKVGSLEVGKRADVIVTDGDPLEIVTHVRRLFIGGEDISLETNQTLLYEKFSKRP